MNSNMMKLGGFIRQTDVRNTDNTLGENDLFGLSVSKEFIATHANLVGVSFESYKVVKDGQFAYIPDTSRRGDKIAIARNTMGKSIIVSSIQCVFEIVDDSKLDPGYLMLWFMRPEFDRYARYMSNGSAREVFDWDCMCNVDIPVPPIEEQRKIVRQYKVVNERINLLQEINNKLIDFAKTKWKNQFSVISPEETKTLSSLCEITSGKRVPKELDFCSSKTAHPYIRVRDISDAGYVSLTDSFRYIDDNVFNHISKYTVNTDDIILSSVGTVGLIGIINNTLDGANLTENCFRLRSHKKEWVYYLFCLLVFYKENRTLDGIVDGSVQSKLPLKKLRKLIIPDVEYSCIEDFYLEVKPLFSLVSYNAQEIEDLKTIRELIMRTSNAIH